MIKRIVFCGGSRVVSLQFVYRSPDVVTFYDLPSQITHKGRIYGIQPCELTRDEAVGEWCSFGTERVGSESHGRA